MASLILEPERLECESAATVAPVAIDDVQSARSRLGAYVHGYPARLHDALDEAYPAVRNIVGRDAFIELARRYRVVVPRGIYSLSDVGRELPMFLASDEIQRRLPFLSDLAKLEWHVLRAFHSFEKEAFDRTELSTWGVVEWQAARIVFQSSVAIVESEWPIADLWNLRETPRDQIDLEIDGRPQVVVVGRRGFDVFCDVVDPLEAQLLRALLDGATLGDALDGLDEKLEVDASSASVPDVGAWLSKWANASMITDVRSRH